MYTQEGTYVGHRVQDNRTKFFNPEDKADADVHARKIGSYVYDIYNTDEVSTDRRVIGHGVPK
jgi:hypothetical protein